MLLFKNSSLVTNFPSLLALVIVLKDSLGCWRKFRRDFLRSWTAAGSSFHRKRPWRPTGSWGRRKRRGSDWGRSCSRPSSGWWSGRWRVRSAGCRRRRSSSVTEQPRVRRNILRCSCLLSKILSPSFLKVATPWWIFYALSSCHISQVKSKCTVNLCISHTRIHSKYYVIIKPEELFEIEQESAKFFAKPSPSFYESCPEKPEPVKLL